MDKSGGLYHQEIIGYLLLVVCYWLFAVPCPSTPLRNRVVEGLRNRTKKPGF
jgi:hypothetical protein